MGNKNVVGAVLALLALAGLLAITGVFLFVKIPEDNQQLVNIALMAIVGNVGTAFGFFLGASIGTPKPLTPVSPAVPGPAPPGP
jgi:CDP-diglyceride synthetase